MNEIIIRQGKSYQVRAVISAPIYKFSYKSQFWSQTGVLLCSNTFITSSFETLKNNLVPKPECPRTKSFKTCDIYKVALGPRCELRPIPLLEKEVCVTAVAAVGLWKPTVALKSNDLLRSLDFRATIRTRKILYQQRKVKEKMGWNAFCDTFPRKQLNTISCGQKSSSMMTALNLMLRCNFSNWTLL